MENVIPNEEAVMNTTDPAKAPIGQAGITPEDPSISVGGDAIHPNAETSIGQLANDADAAPKETPTKQDADRYEYWQSKHDRTAGELSQTQKELEYYKSTLGPVADLVRQNPNIVDTLRQSPSNEQPAQEQNSLKPPSRPDKPHSYSEVDAYNDPDSESFKYRLANDKYRDDMLDYYGKVDNYRQEQQALAYEAQRDQMAQSQARNYAMQSLGWDANKVTNAIQWLQNPSNVSFETLFKVYEMAHAPSKEQVQSQQRVADYQNREERMKVPQSTTVASGTSQAPMNDEQLFNQSMLSWKK
tara:strand:- start:5181 stop:6080 length:900 start_codon:yes stop_codon:yes gene_type:complete